MDWHCNLRAECSICALSLGSKAHSPAFEQRLKQSICSFPLAVMSSDFMLLKKKKKKKEEVSLAPWILTLQLHLPLAQKRKCQRNPYSYMTCIGPLFKLSGSHTALKEMQLNKELELHFLAFVLGLKCSICFSP